MKMTLIRKVFAKDRTMGELHLEGIGYFCDTLEPHCIDWSKEEKVKGKTAIPEGRYKVKVGWSPKWAQNVPWLQKVPHFSGIQIHVGNFPKDTRGCILVGSAEKNILVCSRIVFLTLMNKLEFEKDIEIEVKAHPQPLPGEGSALAQPTGGVGVSPAPCAPSDANQQSEKLPCRRGAGETPTPPVAPSDANQQSEKLPCRRGAGETPTPPDDGLNPILDKFL